MSSAKTSYLISGANRGIGFALVQELAKRPNAIIFAGAREPDSAKALHELSETFKNVHVVKLTSGDAADNAAAVAEVERVAGQLDVVVANAGIGSYMGPVVSTPVEVFREYVDVNTFGPIVLFQAVHQLLIKSPSGAPHFTVISTAAGSISRYNNFGNTPYGMSKAAVNFVVRALHVEHASDGLIVTAISPGFVASDMGNAGAQKLMGMAEAPVSLADSVEGILSRIDGATREKSSGRFWNFKPTFGGQPWDYDGEEYPW